MGNNSFVSSVFCCASGFGEKPEKVGNNIWVCPEDDDPYRFGEKPEKVGNNLRSFYDC